MFAHVYLSMFKHECYKMIVKLVMVQIRVNCRCIKSIKSVLLAVMCRRIANKPVLLTQCFKLGSIT